MPQCRDDECLMGFSTEKHRNAHETIMHKSFKDELLKKVVQKILAQNPNEKTTKKSIKTAEGRFSYQEALNILTSDNIDQQKLIKASLTPVIDLMFAENPEWTAREILSIPEFKIS